MRYISALFIGTICFVSCNQSSTNKATDTESTTSVTTANLPLQSKLSDSATKAMNDLLFDYYAVKNALVATNAARTDSTAKQMMASAEKMQADIAASKNEELLKYADTIVNENKNLLSAIDPTCEKQRLPFSKISDALFTLLKKVELKNAGVYREFCPMAFEDKGAYWLSKESEIKNPYFGKKMLECGEVTDSLK